MIEFHAAEKQHIINYWSRLLKTPEGQNPTNENDLSGNPYYLIGNFGGTTNTRLPNPISSKQSIFVPVNPVAISEPEANPETDLEGIAEADENSASQADLEIDGEKYNVQDTKYRVGTGRFPVNPPTGPCKAAADGYYVVIDPLPPGEHKIIFEGKVDNPYKETVPWRSTNTYTFEVK
jgi:hypothetical protein